ncbi:hypothetical protein Leryth_016837 [Lithospermum erythrorhizon]|nr:hypothetical protein Leryth_016837 [Lithospermum erythrorhizon]
MDVALTVGGCFLSAFFQVSFDRISSTRKFIEFFRGKRVIKFNEQILDKLEITLQTISVVLEDAENKQSKSLAVRRWLDKLKVAVNHADDLMDELNSEAMLLKVEAEKCLAKKTNVSDVELCFSHEFIEDIVPKLEDVTSRLEYFVQQINALGLQKFVSLEEYACKMPSISLVDRAEIFGRDEEREGIIQMVLSDEGRDNKYLCVIPITGLGGVGKTTIARVVYDDERVKNQFPIRAWVCVSEEYDPFRVTKALLLEVNSSVVDDKDDFNSLQIKLKQSLIEKCFLFVLDDIWNDNYNDWHCLKAPMCYGSRGSKIIITTRNEKVAMMMQDEPFYHLKPINNEQSWSLFKSHIIDCGGRLLSPDFEITGQAIVEKCKGLPLAIKTVAGALRSKRDINEWHNMLCSDFWASGSDVLPALSLSYKQLPTHLKSCFAFCAIFPKDFLLDKEEVVWLWMANDLVQPSNHDTKKLEDVGHEYFDELRYRSFFEMVTGNKFLMHDLINDLARYVSGSFCVRLEDYRVNDLPREILHFSYLIENNDTFRKFKSLAHVQRLRTFLPIRIVNWLGQQLTTSFFPDLLPRMRCLRALTLSDYAIKEIPDSVGNLKHLRYLNLSRTLIERLPNAICKCVNLQTLLLAKCFYLVELPKDMSRLINLRHLDVSCVGDILYREMTSWLSSIEDLQNLCIVVDKIYGSMLEKLGRLQPRGFLEVTELESVPNVKSANKAELGNKMFVTELVLRWVSPADDSIYERDILSELQPHRKINYLSIMGYGGTRFPDWLGDSAFHNMVSLCLRDCKNCFILPPLGQLQTLKELYIYGMERLPSIGEEFYGNSSSFEPFQALEKLSISNMEEWTEWYTPSNVEFTSLQELRIRNCPKLVRKLPSHLISLRKFEVDLCPNLISFEGRNGHLDEFEARKCHNLVSIPSHIDKLVIEDCPSLSLSLKSTSIKKLTLKKGAYLEFPAIDSFNSCLESLEIDGDGNSIGDIPLLCFIKLRVLIILSWERPTLFNTHVGCQSSFTPLHSLRISNCSNLLSFPEEGLSAPNLVEFVLWNCEKLKSLPEQLHTLLPSLQDVGLHNCPEIECFPEGGLPSGLKTLVIHDCEKLMISRMNWGLQNLSSLIKLDISGVDDAKAFPEEGFLPSTIQNLTIMDFPNLSSLNHKEFQFLNSLRSLLIFHCPKLQSLPEERPPSSLLILLIFNCPGLMSVPEDGYTSSLSALHVYKCPQLKSCIMEREKGETFLHILKELTYQEDIGFDWNKENHSDNPLFPVRGRYQSRKLMHSAAQVLHTNSNHQAKKAVEQSLRKAPWSGSNPNHN